MPRINSVNALSQAQLRGGTQPAKINPNITNETVKAGRAWASAFQAIGGAFAEVAGRAAAAEDSQNYALATIEFNKMDRETWANINDTADEKGGGYETTAERYQKIMKGITEKYPISDPKKRQRLQMGMLDTSSRRGFMAARAKQARLKKHFAGVEGRELEAAKADILQTPTSENLAGHIATMEELIKSGEGVHATKAEVEGKLRAMRGTLAQAALKSLAEKDPEAAAALFDKIDKKGIFETPKPADAAPVGDLKKYDYRRRKKAAAAVRFNNPGAQYPGPSANKFGTTGTEIIGGGHKIAVFPTAVHGAAAHFDLLNRAYTGMTIDDLVAKWGGGNSPGAYARFVSQKVGLPRNTVITKEMMKNEKFAIAFAQAMAGHETGKSYPMGADGWRAGYRMFRVGSPKMSATPTSQPNQDGMEGVTVEQEAAPGVNFGRLKPGQSFTVEGRLGSFKIDSETWNAMNSAQIKSLTATATERKGQALRVQKAKADQMMANNLEHIKKFGSGAPDFDGNLVAKAYAGNPKKIMEYNAKQAAAQDAHTITDGAASVDAEALRDRLNRHLPQEGMENYAIHKDMYDQASKRINRLVDARDKDPALAVDGTASKETWGRARLVQDVYDELPTGAPRTAKEWFAVIDARMKAQKALGIDLAKPLTAREASDLVIKLRAPEGGDAEGAARNLYRDVVRRYGEGHAEAIVDQVIDQAFKDEERRELFKTTLDSLAERNFRTDEELRALEQERKDLEGEMMGRHKAAAPPTPSTWERIMEAMPSTGEAQKVYMDEVVDRLRAVRKSTGKPEKITPPPGAIKHLQAHPDLAEQFEKTFGLDPGDAKKYLETVVIPKKK